MIAFAGVLLLSLSAGNDTSHDGDTPRAPGWLDAVLSRVSLRETSDPSKVADAAKISVQIPQTGAPAWDIQGYLGANVAWDAVSAHLSLETFVEYHRLSAGAPPQNQLGAGLQAEWLPLRVDVDGWTPDLVSGVNYANDFVQGASALQASATFSPVFRGRGLKPAFFWIPNIVSDLVVALFTYRPLVGLEFQDTFAAAAATQVGAVLRLRAEVAASAFLAHRLFGRAIELLASYEFRWGFLGIVENGSTVHQRLKLGITIYPIHDESGEHDRRAGISAEYVNGENPAKGFQQQQLTTVALKLQL